MSVYGCFNAFDLVLNIMDWFVDELPDNMKIIKGSANLGIQGVQRSWDIIKFSPFYIIPIVGEVFLGYHEIIEEGLGIFYGALDIISSYQCDNTEIAKELCSLLTGLKQILDKSKGIQGKKSKKHINDNISSKGKNIGKKIITNKIMKQVNITENEASDKMSGIMGVLLAEYVKNYKISPLVDILQRGFCDIAFQDENPGKELPNIPNYEVGSFNRWSSSFITSIFCQILEALNDVTKIVWGIGTENQFINMIKTGSFSGLISVIIIIIFYIYTALSSSFGGYKYS